MTKIIAEVGTDLYNSFRAIEIPEEITEDSILYLVTDPCCPECTISQGKVLTLNLKGRLNGSRFIQTNSSNQAKPIYLGLKEAPRYIFTENRLLFHNPNLIENTKRALCIGDEKRLLDYFRSINFNHSHAVIETMYSKKCR